MKTIIIKDHEHDCDHKGPFMKYMGSFCFQYMYKFYCILYCPCWNGNLNCNREHFRYKILSTFADKKSNIPITRCTSLKAAISERKVDLLLQRYVTEICYYSAYGERSEWVFENQIPFKDHLALLINYKKEADLAKLQIHRNKQLHPLLRADIDELYILNNDDYDELSNAQVMKLTDILTKNKLKPLLT